MQRLTLTITPDEWMALCRSAEYNLRDPKREARHILKEALGLTPTTNATNPAAKVSQAATAGFVTANL